MLSRKIPEDDPFYTVMGRMIKLPQLRHKWMKAQHYRFHTLHSMQRATQNTTDDSGKTKKTRIFLKPTQFLTRLQWWSCYNKMRSSRLHIKRIRHKSHSGNLSRVQPAYSVDSSEIPVQLLPSQMVEANLSHIPMFDKWS